MFRMRRYRVFLVFAVIAVGALYHFTTLGGLGSAGAASVEGLKNFGQKIESSSPPASKSEQDSDSEERSNAKDINAPIAVHSLADSGTARPSIAAAQEPESRAKPTSLVKSASRYGDSVAADKPLSAGKVAPTATSTPANKTTKVETGPADPINEPESGKGRMEIIAETGIPKIHWSQQPEHFPIPTEDIIQLPTGKPKAIPQIQHKFTAESASDKAAREDKREIIKKAFSFSWDGYRSKAWRQDELSPISGKHRNPFCGWGATLVDTLDTLWMMDLKDEFEEAVDAVKEIDFTTSARNDIPLFETVIRYLGGLVAAYDISDGTYKVLLDKAVELADILMGAFDTPNRMPMTFYMWKPTFASQPHRAKTRVVLAELGSLSVEFTRLAQITKEARYYDAVARITNEFEIWQNDTRMPGLWPLKIDASGCKKPEQAPQTKYDHPTRKGPTNSKPLLIAEDKAAAADSPSLLDEGPARRIKAEEDLQSKSEGGLVDAVDEVRKAGAKSPAESKSAFLPEAPDSSVEAATHVNHESHDSAQKSSAASALVKREVSTDPVSKPAECEPQGLASPPYTSSEEFGIGGQADSIYEYLPKEYMLLGGLEEKYRAMYEMAADSTIKNLLFRPMIPNEKRHILHAGLAKVAERKNPTDDKVDLKPEGTHLTCFAGAMFAIGAKVFDREDDMDIAWKLTDGCVWAYEATNTGIMPESYLAIPCPDVDSCPWNETLWHESLDPFGDLREKNRISRQQAVLSSKKKAPLDEPVGKGDKTSQTKVTKASSIPGLISSQTKGLIGKKGDAQFVESAISESKVDKSIKPKAALLEGETDELMTKAREADASSKYLHKRQLGDFNEENPIASAGGKAVPTAAAIPKEPKDTVTESTDKTNEESMVEETSAEQHLDKSKAPTLGLKDKATGLKHSNGTTKPTVYTPPPIPTREEFVKARISDERLPAGMTKVTGGRYLLRPEAIESVFVMYRTTGDEYWREKGWEMFKAIEKHTIATYGASAISDVTSKKPVALDEMESFWLAETLKYFYLLFSEPDVVSLDDYVLNTEAHPFKRPT
ncbi:hypothetical protein HO133_005194 [Letharia lupina]|uniref:alpha-1,2-Mannosidase n=1 Tax=Letharia lupina TaxID=560253 RepID=A0A8H6C9T3_9LECA|nr:uncharacterized protein HO133_005194 [Letharia lupina]KAF6219368.1 hypothetical protein HO133_005194 [Letharia lupina]